MRAHRVHAVLSSLLIAFGLAQPLHTRGDAVQCVTGAEQFAPVPFVSKKFHIFRPGIWGTIRYRDLEFMWDSLYAGGLSQNIKSTLESMTSTVVDSVRNPLGAGLTDYALTYNYFRRQGGWYNSTDGFDTTSVVLAPLATQLDSADTLYNPSDRSHSDWYLIAPNDPLAGNQHPAAYIEAHEDTSTGHKVSASPYTGKDTADVKLKNSIQVKGPAHGLQIDLSGTGWTRPDAWWNAGFVHEFQHSMPPWKRYYMIDELFSDAAEAVAGNADTTAPAEVPYTWSLIAAHMFQCNNTDCCTNVRTEASNYQGRALFTRYLAYNFRGSDTSGTAAGLNDDLLRRWSRKLRQPSVGYTWEKQRDFGGLEALMVNDSCGTCVGKNYFKKPDGTPLPNDLLPNSDTHAVSIQPS